MELLRCVSTEHGRTILDLQMVKLTMKETSLFTDYSMDLFDFTIQISDPLYLPNPYSSHHRDPHGNT